MKLFEIGKKVRELRKEQGLTQEELAKKAEISRVTLGKLERGQVSAVSVRTLDILLFTLKHELAIVKSDEGGFGIPTLDEMRE